MEVTLPLLPYSLVRTKFPLAKSLGYLIPKATKKWHLCLANSATCTAPVIDYELENKKHDLLRAVQDTQRGLNTTEDQRLAVEEALVAVEGFDAGAPVDLVQLDGTWRLQYTTAADVLVLFDGAARLPLLQVGQIFQKFECRDRSDEGIVRNVIKWSIDNILEEQDGATLVVTAKFSVVSQRNIQLEFDEVSLQDIKISEELQAVIAPAILPRSFISLQVLTKFPQCLSIIRFTASSSLPPSDIPTRTLVHYASGSMPQDVDIPYDDSVQILQFLRGFKAQIPIGNPNGRRQTIGGLYYLSYLDDYMLLGRSVGGGGVFVFTRAQPLIV
ncbi:putative plastid-lipid-associated protein 10, chloroplastic [Drosera capensis]